MQSRPMHIVDSQGREWWAVQDLNLRPPACKADAPPTLRLRSLVAHLPWAHSRLLQRLHPFRPAFSLFNRLGNLLFA